MSPVIQITHPSPAVGVITINRPEKRNALDEAAWAALAQGLETLGEAPDVRVIVLTGVPGAFCAGDDIHAFSCVKDDPAARDRYWNTIMRSYAALSRLPVPIIAAIDGPCVGGGMTLALRADFRVIGQRAVFSVPPAKLGLVYPADSTARLASAIGTQAARYMIYTAEPVDAAQAAAFGLGIGGVAEDPLEAALTLAAKIAGKAPLTISAAKRVFDGLDGQIPEGLGEEIEARTRAAEASADYTEGVAAFAEKRAPKFTGR
ncbi:MAG: enoyl-CoA hydratase/isomerase family protein [Roseovarius sp.]